jgi:hypothetical protein
MRMSLINLFEKEKETPSPPPLDVIIKVPRVRDNGVRDGVEQGNDEYSQSHEKTKEKVCPRGKPEALSLLLDAFAPSSGIS